MGLVETVDLKWDRNIITDLDAVDLNEYRAELSVDLSLDEEATQLTIVGENKQKVEALANQIVSLPRLVSSTQKAFDYLVSKSNTDYSDKDLDKAQVIAELGQAINLMSGMVSR